MNSPKTGDSSPVRSPHPSINHSMNEAEKLQPYTEALERILLRLAEEEGLLGKQLLETDDLTELFPELTQAYLGDAVPDFEQYPLVSLSWIAFVGMAMAALWDSDWGQYGAIPAGELYQQIRDARGWDELDEYVLEEAIGLHKESDEAKRYTAFLRRATEQAYSALMHERAEPSTPLAFQLYGRTLYALYRLGIALGLNLLGYKLHRSQAN